MSTIAEEVVKGLLDIQAVSVSIDKPFMWASGIKSPIYCDNRKSIGHYALRRRIARGLSVLIKDQFGDVDVIGGTATAGIPHATSVADNLALPLVYFRSTQKEHGTKSMIEGHFRTGQKIVIVEDLISTGGSVLKCVEHAKTNGLDVLGVVSIVHYELKEAVDNFATAGVDVVSLAGFSEIYKALALTDEQTNFIDVWRQNPYDAKMWQ